MATEDKSKRPKFSAPVPPAPKADVVENADKHPVTDTVPASEPDTTVAVDTGSPSPKVVSRDPASAGDINDVLAQTTTAKVPPPPPASSKKSKEGSNCNAILVGIATFSFIIGIAGWVLYFTATTQINPFSQGGQPEAGSLTPSPAPSPTAAAVDRSVIKLEVLNGSGVAGAAGSSADKLKALGYTIADTGNADDSDYTTAQVTVVKDFAHTDLLLSDLEKEFGSAASVSGTLDSDTADAQIIVGTDWAE